MTREEIMDLINRSLFATIGYADGGGMPSVRRVFCVWHRGLGRHLISTNTSSAHVQSLLRDNRICLYFSDDAAFEGVCLQGEAIVHRDRPFKELLWNDGDEKYYPGGIDDEDYCVLEVVARSARFYRYDGKGEMTKREMDAFDRDREFENGYLKHTGTGE